MADEKFELVSSYQPTGDQPQAIETLVKGVERGDRCQTLLGVTGSGKTFTMANVIAQMNPPTLVMAHQKTLAAPGPCGWPVAGGAPRPGAAQSPYMLLRARISATLPLFMRETPLTFEYPR